ncbi:MAG: hypothetical protein MAG453_02008 [Calditrichaeota bacterium]|nr:hypothetical protein [Calditrichota bacterium]
MAKEKPETRKELRKFGITMAVAFAVVSAIVWWNGHELAWKTLAGIGGLFLLTGLLVPAILRPIEWAWMKFAHALGIVVTYTLLTLTFFLIITPIGLIVRLTGKDPLNLKKRNGVASYWVLAEKEGPQSRPDKPY